MGLALVFVVTAAGCGSGHKATPAALKLEREDLVATAAALRSMQAPVAREVAATKASWGLIANGLPQDTRVVSSSPAAARALTSSSQLRLPSIFGEAQARELTGPASQISGLFRAYALLCSRGWRLLFSSIAQIQSGTPAAARFARANAALYVESVYDAHFTLAQIGKQLRKAYDKLGGAGAFGTALSAAQVDRLTAAYSEASDRLHPHVGVRLGS